jgi:hypothetical protein
MTGGFSEQEWETGAKAKEVGDQPISEAERAAIDETAGALGEASP